MTKFLSFLFTLKIGDNMLQIEVFDEEHEKDLQYRVNNFLTSINDSDIVDIKYSVAGFLGANGEQIYCYSALIIYRIYK